MKTHPKGYDKNIADPLVQDGNVDGQGSKCCERV
jgi:hypothetical protein